MMNDDVEHVIEFRNGTLFQSLEAEHGGPLATAQRDRSEAAAAAFMDEHQWIYFNGGMAMPAAEKAERERAFEESMRR